MKNSIFLGRYAALATAKNLGILEQPGVDAWQAWQSPAKEVYLQGVNKQGTMVGPVFEIRQDDLHDNFTILEHHSEAKPGNYREISASDPALLDYWLELALAMKHQDAGTEKDTSTVESTQKNAEDSHDYLSDDGEQNYIFEEMIRAEFSSLLTRWQASPSEENLQHLKEIIEVQGDLRIKQKIMFSEFGLTLRKYGLHELALQSHLRALELDPHDPRVLFNVARSQIEVGQNDSALENLRKALNIDPHFQNARAFLEFLQGHNL